ncbi:MAG TPA: HEAT repeat domain-containing protein [Planctomycetes bacterium]|nr:HEAT repeat domain-containing protein [Fuerstiella sp.]HIM28853.1 HEAT repeat domain-containing protein [Planctomycetota bacterium]
MARKNPTLSTAEILKAVRSADVDDVIIFERETAKQRLKQGVRYTGPRYSGRTIEEWMDRADAGLASIHDIRKAFYRITPKAKECVPSLMRWLSHRHKHFRHVATRTLGLIGPDAADATDELARLLSDADSFVRGEALAALEKIGVRRTEVAKIASCVVDSDKFVQRSAIDALAQVGVAAAEAVPKLMAALDNDQLIGHAANALAAIGPKEEAAVPVLARIHANHEFVEYRCAEAAALGCIGTDEAIKALQNGLNDRRKEVRKAAADAIKAAQQ